MRLIATDDVLPSVGREDTLVTRHTKGNSPRRWSGAAEGLLEQLDLDDLLPMSRNYVHLFRQM